MTSPLSPEAVAQMPWRYEIKHGPDGEQIYAWVYEGTRMVATMKLGDAIKATTLAAENATLRASEAAALEALAEIGAVVAALEGKDSLDREMIRNIGTRIAALTPTADKEPKT